ncbi:MAG: hypothetical protein ACTS8S_04905 [Giesbergeria sp.]
MNDDYKCQVNEDKTILTVTTELNEFHARLHWPDNWTVSEAACLLVGKPVICKDLPDRTAKECRYQITEETRPVFIALAEYRIAQDKEVELCQRLIGEAPDDGTPVIEIWRNSPEWHAAKDAVQAAYERYKKFS